MTREEHRQRHVELHAALDELMADWARHNAHGGKRFSNTTIKELMNWSYEQTKEPVSGHGR
jgi:hypothetical protein